MFLGFAKHISLVLLLLIDQLARGAVGSVTAEEYRVKDLDEFYVGCYWTLRVHNGICNAAGNCFEAKIVAATLQDQFFDFYESSSTSAPPIEQVQWLLQVPDVELQTNFHLCPGLILTALVFDATLRLPIDGLAAASVRFKQAEHLLATLPDDVLDVAFKMFPLQLAIDRFIAEEAALPASPREASASFVVTRCRNSLDWLRNVTIPATAQLHVYEKCNASLELGEAAELETRFASVTEHAYVLDNVDGVMTGECAGYLQFIVDYYDSLPDFVFLLHDDAYRHLKIPFLKVLTRALVTSPDSLKLDMVHLNYVRVASLNTPCMRQVFQDVFHEELPGRLATYCCGQFLVTREAIHRRPKAFYEDLLLRLRRNWDQVCSLGDMPCYVLEFLWQKVWRNSTQLPLRSQDASLPLFARHDHFQGGFMPGDFSLWFSRNSAWTGV